MKKLFEFKLDRDISKLVKETEENEKGETVTIEKTVVTSTKQNVVLKKPTRSLFDDAELFYGVKLSEGIKAGLLTRALLAKRFSNDGGVLSEDEKDRYADLYLKLYEAQLDTERASTVPEKKRTEQEQERLEGLLKESAELRKELTDFEMAQSSLFEQTAENRARNKTILWWVLNLAYLEDEDGKFSLVFEGKTFEEKLDSYDVLEDSEDDFDEQLLQKLIYYISFWYVGRVGTQEEFEKLLEDSGEEGVIASKEDVVKEDKPKEKAKEEVKEEVKEETVEEGTTVEIKEPRDEIQEKTASA